jgi:MoaA/NifB/PqqE/SkfB family radical SAM enzyme
LLTKQIKELPGFRYITLLTHGGSLTEVKVKELVAAGVNQINVSMNYPDARQDEERGLPRLFERLERIIPKMAAEGHNVFSLASMLMVDNMHEAEGLIRLAHKWGINIAFSGYNDMKNGNQSHFVGPEKMAEFRSVCSRIIELKRKFGNVMTSDYFFETLPDFYEKRSLPGCKAGKIMIHVSPKGMVQPCAELAAVGHYSEFVPRKYNGPNCGACFDACRSEAEAPLTLRRLGELTGIL